MASNKGQGAAQGAMSGAAMGTAVMPGWGTVVGGLLGGVAGAMAPDDGSDQYAKMLEVMQKVESPNFNPADLTADEIPYVGSLYPALYEQIQLERPELVIESQRLITEQNMAKEAMKEVADQQGLDLQSKAALQEAMDASNANQRAQNQTIANNARSRGLGVANEAALQSIAQQGNADRSSRNALAAASDARSRALAALSNYSNMVTGMRTQDTNNKRFNTDVLNQFKQANWRNAQDISNQNTSTLNASKERNLNMKQGLAEANANIRNDFKNRRNQAELNKKNFELQKAGGTGQAYQQMGQVADSNRAAYFNNLAGFMNMGATAYNQNKKNNSTNSSNSYLKVDNDRVDRAKRLEKYGN